jgi:hypothetical protein
MPFSGDELYIYYRLIGFIRRAKLKPSRVVFVNVYDENDALALGARLRVDIDEVSVYI